MSNNNYNNKISNHLISNNKFPIIYDYLIITINKNYLILDNKNEKINNINKL